MVETSQNRWLDKNIIKISDAECDNDRSYFWGGAHGVIVIFVGNKHGEVPVV